MKGKFSSLFRSKAKEKTGEVRQCGNCDKLLGKLEKRYTYKEKIVCEPCYNLLQRTAPDEADDETKDGKENTTLGLGILLVIGGIVLHLFGLVCFSWVVIIVGIVLALAGLVIKGWKSFSKEMNDKES
jgi:hypothetical protein